MGEKTADGDVVDALPVALANVSREGIEVTGVGLDGVGGGVALAEMAEESVGGALDGGAQMLFHQLAPQAKRQFTTEAQRHGKEQRRLLDSSSRTK